MRDESPQATRFTTTSNKMRFKSIFYLRISVYARSAGFNVGKPRLKVLPIGLRLCGEILQREVFHDRDTVAVDAHNLLWMICQQADLMHAESPKHLGSDTVNPQIAGGI